MKTWSGAAYVFKRSGAIWNHEAYLKAPNTEDFAAFAGAVSVSGDTVVVGATGESSSTTAIINGDDLTATDNSSNSSGAPTFVRQNQ